MEEGRRDGLIRRGVKVRLMIVAGVLYLLVGVGP